MSSSVGAVWADMRDGKGEGLQNEKGDHHGSQEEEMERGLCKRYQGLNKRFLMG